jgi:hypothetical protein
MAVTNLLAQSCNKADNAIKLVTSCKQLVSNLLQQTGNKQCEHNLLTACEQTCDSLFADLLQLVRFYVCTWTWVFNTKIMSWLHFLDSSPRSRYIWSSLVGHSLKLISEEKKNDNNFSIRSKDFLLNARMHYTIKNVEIIEKNTNIYSCVSEFLFTKSFVIWHCPMIYDCVYDCIHSHDGDDTGIFPSDNPPCH